MTWPMGQGQFARILGHESNRPEIGRASRAEQAFLLAEREMASLANPGRRPLEQAQNGRKGAFLDKRYRFWNNNR
jgi:hypothetical protein